MTYQPTLASVKTHPMPEWYNDAKFGIFIHWGLYSVPAFAPQVGFSIDKMLSGEMSFEHVPYAEWYQNSLRVEGSPTHQYHTKNYGADFHYEQFAPMLNEQLQKWQPDAWAELFERVGARYVVLVTKHHDGFLMWNSRHPNPRIPNWQTERDVVGELTQAVSARGMKMGLYYSSLIDWSFTQYPVTSLAEVMVNSEASREYLDYIEKQWRELIDRYDPWILWGDIGYPPGFELPKLFADFYNHKPEGVINDRWTQMPKFLYSKFGRSMLSQIFKRMGQFLMKRMVQGESNVPHCDFITPEYTTLNHAPTRKWEACRGIGNSFGFNQFETVKEYMKADELIRLLADIVSKNGNLLLNVGPCADGTIHPAQLDALEGIGAWLKANGDSIYGTRPWLRHTDSDENGAQVQYTAKGAAHFAIVTKMPANGVLSLPVDAANGRVTLLETGDSLQVTRSGEKFLVTLPPDVSETSVPVIKIQK